MEFTQAPIGWEDNSELEAGESSYMFKLTSPNKRASIFKHEWMNQTKWTLNISKRETVMPIVVKIGEFEKLSDAVKIGEQWINSTIKFARDFAESL